MTEFRKKFLKIVLLTSPLSKAGCIPASNLIDVLFHFVDQITLITGNDALNLFKNDKRMQVFGIHHTTSNNILTRIGAYIQSQLSLSFYLYKKCKDISIIFIFIGDELIFPILCSKFLKKKIIIVSGGSPKLILKSSHDPFYLVMALLIFINYSLADKIILYSKQHIQEYSLDKFKHKIVIAPRHFIRTNSYEFSQNSYQRNNIVGYLGRYSEEKGVLNLIIAAKILSQNRNDVHFIITGEGALKIKMMELISEHNLEEIVKLSGWIDHDEIGKYLKTLKILIIPSFTEGLPNVMLEAMASGTPVLATPVGAIPDVIRDGHNGYIMENNSPDCIAKNIIRILDSTNINEIILNARNMIEQIYSYENIIINYKNILTEFGE